MKKQISLLTIMTLLGTTACQDFLTENPVTNIGQNLALSSEDRIRRAMNGAYSALQVNEYYGFEWPNAVWLSDDNVFAAGAGTTDLQFDNYDILASSNTMEINWRAMYQVINQANNILDAVGTVGDPGFTTEEKNDLAGQALFLRALAYFDMVRTWGGVPLVLTPTAGFSDAAFVKRNSPDEVYAQVQKDLDEAEQKLPERTDRTLAGKKTAQALKARLFLYRKDWANAEKFAGMIIESKDYALVTPYERFLTEKNTPESIFEIAYNPVDQNATGGAFLPQSKGGSYRLGPTKEIVDLLRDPAKGGTRSVTVGTFNLNGTTTYHVNKYRQAGSTNDSPIWVLRTAEMYLIRAEARAQLGKIQEGAADLNAVRQRAQVAAVSPATKEDLLQRIEDERRLEFAFEPHRWFDLVRTGRAGTVLKITTANKLVFPVPTSEIRANPNLTQNTGY
ncbi:RagB/SusD family nutrient uptake outer membrane protein [Larkinella soli]|uniref:RagB/SusD family nutrient uptake outer membrane protein n=1 Tax=Larkinella soli TaxID=1770527 RepID=UPI000FFBC15A|nr:RagB/SusD family nutrient uptake outer membrane protein [Larkinella soli]